MNRLALAFGIVCLLQGLSAAPRPEYGLSVTIKNSGKLTAVGDAVSDIVDDIDGIVLATLSAGYEKYDSTLDVISNLIDDVSNVIDPILTAYIGLLADTSGNVDNAFAAFLSAINDALDYLSYGTDIQGYLTTLDGNEYSGIVDQLEDEGFRLVNGLQFLSYAASTVKYKLAAAVTEAGSASVPANILNSHLELSDMYQFLLAANNLIAYLPLLGYILSTVNEHLQEGDDFITNLQSMIDDDTDFAVEDFQDDLYDIISEIEDAISFEMGDIYTAYSEISTAVADLALSAATDYSTLVDTLESFISAFDDTDSIEALALSLAAAFQEILTQLGLLADDLTAAFSVVDEVLVQLLVDSLVGNLKYGEYCYYKYKDLVENLYNQGLEGGWECVDKEYMRLEQLMETLFLIIDLLIFDFQDLLDELTVCDMISDDTASLNGCVTELSGYYSDLLDATVSKRDLLYDLAEGEAEASKNRLLICLELVYIDTTVTQAAALTDGLNVCVVEGPTGSD